MADRAPIFEALAWAANQLLLVQTLLLHEGAEWILHLPCLVTALLISEE